MKITAIRLIRLRCPLDPPFLAAWDPFPRRAFRATLTVVETDEGVRGIASGDTMDGFEPYVELFLGQDPLAIARHAHALETIAFHSGRYWPFEAALWDILGQACGRPVATLFGGTTDHLPAYASCGELKPPRQRAESALALHEEGFRALKIRIHQDALREGMEAVRATRQAVGDSMDILVDLNQAWRTPGDQGRPLDGATVRRLADECRALDVLWLEEPLPASDVKGLAALRAATGMRIAGGEMNRDLPSLLAYLDADALDVYQPDVVLAVGMSGARLVAELAHARHRWFSPHTWTNGLGLLANLHVSAGVGAGPYLEFPYDPPGWTVPRRDFFLAERVSVGRDGCVRVPDRPGLGVVLDEDAVERFTIG
jgi:L-alanine-DL-glutamate epimerase-like enolase superfamily enzyme